jgi:prevent-host-death family protein
MQQIGVRELRQHASRFLARVRNGEVLEVTDRGTPVARLVPVPSDRWAALVAAGQVVAADDGVDVAQEAPRDYGVDASLALAVLRSDER